jgi:hypothetical protein
VDSSVIAFHLMRILPLRSVLYYRRSELLIFYSTADRQTSNCAALVELYKKVNTKKLTCSEKCQIHALSTTNPTGLLWERTRASEGRS